MNNLWFPALTGKCPLQELADERSAVWLWPPVVKQPQKLAITICCSASQAGCTVYSGIAHSGINRPLNAQVMMTKHFKRERTSLGASDSSVRSEWDEKRNAPLTVFDVAQYSNKKVWWRCPKGHSYAAVIANRTKNGTGCPYCDGRMVTREASFAALHPDVMREWDYEKNCGIDPFTLTPATSKKMWWKCVAGHSWLAAVQSRSRKSTSCEMCRGRVASPEQNATTEAPEILEFWDWNSNSVTPTEVSISSSYQVSWLCPNGHRWTSRIHEFLKRKKTNCLFCSSLGFAYPELVKEWDFAKNDDVDPLTVQPSSFFNAHWRCARGHEWRSKVAIRTRGASCTRCRSNQTSAPEIRLFTELLWLFNDDEIEQKEVRWRSRVVKKEIDIYIPSINLCIEHDGSYFHAGKNDESKNLLLEENGYTVLRVREEPLKPIRSHDVTYRPGKLDYAEVCSIISFIGQKSDITEATSRRVIEYLKAGTFLNSDLYEKLISMLPSPLFADSLEAGFPELASEWDFEKNSFGPSEVRPFSTLEVNWKCKNGHIWRQSVWKRAMHGKKCKGCNSLAFSNPDVAAEWSDKNFPLTPYDISRANGKIFWWKCSQGHEWQAAVNARTKRLRATGCPHCSSVKNQHNSQSK